MLKTLSFVISSVAVLAVIAGPVLAQTPVQAQKTDGPFSVSFVGGLSTGSDTGAAAGATVAFDLTDRVTFEGIGTYLDRGAGASALAANASLLIGLLAPDRKAIPYLAVGGGLYRASFDLDDRRFLGNMGLRFGPGTMMIPLQNMQAYGMPPFYARRMGPRAVAPDGRWGERTFADPMLSFGGGVRFDLTPHLFVRPDARALVVIGDGDTYTVGSFGVNVGYRF